ncbi:MAG: hypothetical protein ACI84C_001912 [Flavobacteriales bacterium]|jgi:hypothetical protein
MKTTLLALFACFCLSSSAQTYLEDSVLIQIENTRANIEFDYSPSEDWQYFLIPDTLTIVVTRSQPALSSCGNFNFAEIIYGVLDDELVRLLVPCGQTSERPTGVELNFVQARPIGRVSDHEFRIDDLEALQHVTEIKRTAWAQVVQ